MTDAFKQEVHSTLWNYLQSGNGGATFPRSSAEIFREGKEQQCSENIWILLSIQCSYSYETLITLFSLSYQLPCLSRTQKEFPIAFFSLVITLDTNQTAQNQFFTCFILDKNRGSFQRGAIIQKIDGSHFLPCNGCNKSLCDKNHYGHRFYF